MAIRAAILGSGSAGNATCIEGGGSRLLLDAGFSCRQLTDRLAAIGVAPESLDGIVVTHEHADHVRGAARFSTTHGVPIYCTPKTARAAGLDADGLPILPIEADRPFAIGGLEVSPFPVPHDAVETIGCAVISGGARIGYATDLGHAAEAVRIGLGDCDLLILEANHDAAMLDSGPYPEMVKRRVRGRHGHLDNETSAGLVSEVVSERTLRVVLAHLSARNNRPDLAIAAVRRRLDRDGRRRPGLCAAGQDAPSPWFEI
jgi:phosphoribosyl 1,2-cyclic phosphodiesterase